MPITGRSGGRERMGNRPKRCCFGGPATSPRTPTNILHTLEETGAARKPASGQICAATEHSAALLAEAGLRQQDLQKALRGPRLEQMQEYAETRGCRREFLLRSFGDSHSGPCGNCDFCEQSTAQHARGA